MFKITKLGHDFYFRNPIYQDGTLIFQHMVKGEMENKINDGFYSRKAIYLPKSKSIKIYDLELDGKRYAGIKVPPEYISKLDSLYTTMKSEYIKKETNKDICYKLHDTTSYGIYNGISQYSIALIFGEILRETPNSDKCSLFAEDIAKKLTKDPQIINIANRTYKPLEENPQWKESYKKLFRESVKNRTAVGYGTIPNNIIKDKIKGIIVSEINKVEETESEQKYELEKLKKKAKDTGINQLFRTWMEPCSDKEEECNTDICTIYITPNGKQVYERQHTW